MQHLYLWDNKRESEKYVNEISLPLKPKPIIERKGNVAVIGKKISAQYIEYKTYDEIFREWLNSVCTSTITVTTTVDDLVAAVDEVVENNINLHLQAVEIPDNIY